VVGAVGLVVCAAGGALEVTDGLVTPLLEAGHRVTLTPTAASWFPAGSVDALERLTGFAVRSQPRLPHEQRPSSLGELVLLSTRTTNARSLRLAARLGFIDIDRHERFSESEWFGVRPALGR